MDVIGDGIPVVAALDGTCGVSFAYVASETETLWDVSIDTVSSHRRKGYAESAVLALMEIIARSKQDCGVGSSAEQSGIFGFGPEAGVRGGR